MLHEAGYMIGPDDDDLSRLREELTKGFEERERNGGPAGRVPTPRRTSPAFLPPMPTTDAGMQADTTTTHDAKSNQVKPSPIRKHFPRDRTAARSNGNTGGGSQSYGDRQDDSDFQQISPEHQRNLNTKPGKGKENQGESENKENHRKAAVDPGSSSAGEGKLKRKKEEEALRKMKEKEDSREKKEKEKKEEEERKKKEKAEEKKKEKEKKEAEERKKKEKEEKKKEKEARKEEEDQKKKEKESMKKIKGAETDTEEEDESSSEEEDEDAAITPAAKAYLKKSRAKMLKSLQEMINNMAVANRQVQVPPGHPSAADWRSAEADGGPKAKKRKTGNGEK